VTCAALVWPSGQVGLGLDSCGVSAVGLAACGLTGGVEFVRSVPRAALSGKLHRLDLRAREAQKRAEEAAARGSGGGGGAGSDCESEVGA
jgi:hypothetical protein